MVWVGSDLIDHVVLENLPWAGTPSTRPGCSKSYPAWSSALSAMGNSQFLRETCSIASLPS